jgi:hypothetical protein
VHLFLKHIVDDSVPHQAIVVRTKRAGYFKRSQFGSGVVKIDVTVDELLLITKRLA